MTHYETLGIPTTASEYDIKRAFRKLAGRHHPDKGGDVSVFQEVQNAYAVLSDPIAKSKYDLATVPVVVDVTHTTVNKNIMLQVNITLFDVLYGKHVLGVVKLTHGEQPFEVYLPPGLKDKEQVIFAGLGDNAYDTARGDLVIQVTEIKSKTVVRLGDSLATYATINAFDAIVGCNVPVYLADETIVEVAVPAGTQHGAVIEVKNSGVPNRTTGKRGELLVEVRVTIPTNLSTKDKAIIKTLQSKHKT